MIDKALIADCVHCGFCLPTCPTYALWGEEMDSPRGRIHLMKQASDGGAISEAWTRHLDLCLGCLACETACPSGVRYGELLEATREEIEARGVRTTTQRFFRALLFALLPWRGRLRILRGALRVYRGVGLARLMSRVSTLPPSIRALLRLSPPLLPKQPVPAVTPAQGEERQRAFLLTGCVQSVFFSHVNAATARVLAAEGVTVLAPAEQSCCGALSLHAGRGAEARELARRTIDGFERSGAAVVQDLTQLLAQFEPRATRNPLPLRVAYHDACHLAHAQRIRKQPRELLRGIPGLELFEIAEAESCCGSAGIYNLVEPVPARALGERKARHVLATGAQAVATSNPGCMVQLQAALADEGRALPVYHLVELIDASLRGTKLA